MMSYSFLVGTRAEYTFFFLIHMGRMYTMKRNIPQI